MIDKMVYAMKCSVILIVLVKSISMQDYDVTDIQCTFGGSTSGSAGGSIAALLRKPDGFRGAPLFADDRTVSPLTDPACQIRPEHGDPTGLLYRLKITDFSRCGVLKRNGFVHVRVWFPQFPGVVMQSDQELIIMCKPPEPTVIENKAAGFAGSFPHGARVSGVVEETPGRLEYEVALYKEAPASSRLANSSGSELPVDQAVPIGTKLQLRARISAESAWRYVKLLEVTVSPDPELPHAPASVALVKDGCRNRDFVSIIPHQPARYRERPNEVFLDFEAFLLSSMRERSTLWIHSQIKACMDAADCQPDFCLDLFEPSGHGRRRRSLSDSNSSYSTEGESITSRMSLPSHKSRTSNTSRASRATQYFNGSDSLQTPNTRFKENLEYTVLMPGEMFYKPAYEPTCTLSMIISATFGCLLFFSGLMICFLAMRLNGVVNKSRSPDVDKTLQQIVREVTHAHTHSGHGAHTYTGRPTVQ